MLPDRLPEGLAENITRRKTREVTVGNLIIGGEAPIVVQSMTATKTQDVTATVAQVNMLEAAGAGIVRIAVDSQKDVQALAQIRAQTTANLAVDLQENWRLAALVALHVDKIRYNPGHLYHHERTKSTRDKVAFIVDFAAKYDCAIRIGVNYGSVDPDLVGKFANDAVTPIVESALEHCQILDDLGFGRYVVSLKDSDPKKVIEANLRFAKLRPDVPLHLGVTEAGLPPEGVIKTRTAFEYLLAFGIGETLRVSLTVPSQRKWEEVAVAHQIIEDVVSRRFTSPAIANNRLNIIACPSCSRVENESFVELAETVRKVTDYARQRAITIAVMGCRVNGPGETDVADIGLWCGPKHVNLKLGSLLVGTFSYDEIIPRFLEELNRLIARNNSPNEPPRPSLG